MRSGPADEEGRDDVVPMPRLTTDPYKAVFVAQLEVENATLRAENSRLKKAVHEIQQSALWALRFEPEVPVIDGDVG